MTVVEVPEYCNFPAGPIARPLALGAVGSPAQEVASIADSKPAVLVDFDSEDR